MTKIIEISQKSAISMEKLLSLLQLKKKKVIFITDNNIWGNCNKFFSKDFLNINENLILQNPQADEKTLNKVTVKAKNFDFIIAFGSGTINDLCKLSAANLKIPYAIFISATSMNGYLSKNASITIKGHKKTAPATLPNAAFYNLQILKEAPLNLIKAGIGDSICFYSCWFDWYLSHLILKTKFNEKPFKLLSKKMEFFIKNYQKFSLKDEKLLKILIEILLLSGQGMTIAGGSYPASQSEHLIAHCLNMKYPEKMKNILHGNQIAITTLTSAKLQENLIKKTSISLKRIDFFPNNFFNKKITAECKKEFLLKKLNNEEVEKINCRLKKEWKNYRIKLSKIYCDSKIIKEILFHFKIRSSFAKKDVSALDYKECVNYAPFIRNRFTCLDLK